LAPLPATLGLIDYGMGNLHSVTKAFERLDRTLQPVRSSKDLSTCDALILPGVGAFDPAMDRLEATGLVPDLQAWGRDHRPLLGICLGLQLLFEGSAEGSRSGLGLIPGQVERLPEQTGERIPHMGWAPLTCHHPNPLLHENDQPTWVYFVHSYAAKPSHDETLAATAPFGSSSVTAMVWSNRIGACQFHPEKSSDAGALLLQRWLDWIDRDAPILS
jgi:glutamine amidotransferase